jgi:vancomycin aglycone glucosyltransferase
MRVSFSTHGSRRNVGPMLGLAVQPGTLGEQMRVCALSDFADLMAGLGVPLSTSGAWQ